MIIYRPPEHFDPGCGHSEEFWNYCLDCETGYCGRCQDAIHAHVCGIRALKLGREIGNHIALVVSRKDGTR